MKKYVYKFYNNKAEGSASMQNLLGGKVYEPGRNDKFKIPVPGFTITTEACVYYMKHNKYPPGLKKQVNEAIIEIENFMNKNFGSNSNPLLFSVRSGARHNARHDGNCIKYWINQQNNNWPYSTNKQSKICL